MQLCWFTAVLLLANGVAYADAYQDIQKYTAQIAQNHFDAEAYNERGLAYKNLGQYERAIQDYSKAIQLNKGYAKAYYNRGNAYKALGNMTSANANFAKARELGYNG